MNGTMKDSFLDGASGNQVKKMPTASKVLLDIVVQFIGETGTYIQNFFYKCIGTAIESVISAEIGESAGITGATVVKATFEAMRDATGQYIFEFKESLISAVIGDSTGITSASVVKATFEELITDSGAYNFTFIDSLISASIGSSTGITSATAVKTTFETQIDETSENSFVYNESTANASIGASVGITEATVDKSIFETLISVSGDTVFTFDGTDWKIGETVVDLEDYGIVVTGTAQANDAITITYAAAKWTLSDVEVDLEDYGITFEGTPNDGDTINISYTQSKWELESNVIDLADYGITYVGTPEDGDTITINYTSDNWYFEDEIVDIADYGISVTGTPAYDDTVIVDYTAAYTAYSWVNIKVQESNDNLVTKGVWTATGQTDFSTIPLPVSKGWAFFVNGSATINSVDYSSGDLIVFTKDIAEGGTITDDDFDLNDINIVTKDNTIIITNKTIDADNNTISNLELDNLKTGVIKTTIRATGVAEDTSLATEKAVRTELDKKQDTLLTATKTVEGKARFATDAEIVLGASENTMVNAKNLKDRGADFEQSDFELQENVLSSAVKKVVANSSFFIFENGDVSIDGKTVLKANTVDGSVIDLYADDDYAAFVYSKTIKFYTIATDGTLTLFKTVTITGSPSSFNKFNLANTLYCITGRNSDNQRGIYTLAKANLSSSELNFIAFTSTQNSSYTPLKVFYKDGNYCVLASYDNGFVISSLLYFSTDITTIFTANEGISYGNGGQLGNDAIMEDNSIIVVSGDTRTVVFTELSSPAVYTGYFASASSIRKINGIFYFFDESTGECATTEDITQTPVLADDSAYDIAEINKKIVKTLNSDDILLSEEVKIPILQSEVIDSSTAAIVIAKVKNNTVYKYGIIDSLAITAVEVSNRKSIIYFSTSASFTAFTPPASQAFIGSSSVVGSKNYKIEIENGIMEVKEYSVPS